MPEVATSLDNEPQSQVLAVLVGRPWTYTTPDLETGQPTSWRTAIYKKEVTGAVFLGTLGLTGDGQADHRHHGGPDQAVLCYSAEHYPLWRIETGRTDLAYGEFGENLVVTGFADHTVCIGDVFDVGLAQVQVTKPREPCLTLARKWGDPGIVRAVWQNQRGGWYVRVLREGSVQVGDRYTLVSREAGAPTVADALRTKTSYVGSG